METPEFEQFVNDIIDENHADVSPTDALAIVSTAATKIHQKIMQIAAIHHNDKNDTISAKNFLATVDQYMHDLYGSTHH